MTDRIQKWSIHLNLVKSLLQHHQTRMTHDTQLSNGPIGASIRVREVPIQDSTMSTDHISLHTALELRAKQGRVHVRCSCS